MTRERLAVVALVVFALVMFGLWHPLRNRVMTALVLRSDAPSAAVLTEVVEGASDPAKTLERIWRRGSFSGRAFVVGHLSHGVKPDVVMARRMESLLEEAAFDADLEVRDAALGLLSRQKPPALRGWLREQLHDPDPAVRVLALQQFSRIAVSGDVPVVLPLLDDPDPRVIAAAGTALKRITGEDCGLKVAQAPPIFVWKVDAAPSPPDWSAIQQGRDRWRAWWRAQQSQFPVNHESSQQAPHIYPRSTPDIALEDLDGRRVRLSEFRGRTVLLTFWNLTNQLSGANEPMLQTLLQRESAQLSVLAIAVDPALWPEESCGDHKGGDGHRESDLHEHAQGHTTRPDPTKTRSAAGALAARLGVKYPVLLDRKAVLVTRFDLHDLPACVLIDSQGNLRRRIFGPRSATVFEAMLKEATATDLPRSTVTPQSAKKN